MRCVGVPGTPKFGGAHCAGVARVCNIAAQRGRCIVAYDWWAVHAPPGRWPCPSDNFSSKEVIGRTEAAQSTAIGHWVRYSHLRVLRCGNVQPLFSPISSSPGPRDRNHGQFDQLVSAARPNSCVAAACSQFFSTSGTPESCPSDCPRASRTPYSIALTVCAAAGSGAYSRGRFAGAGLLSWAGPTPLGVRPASPRPGWGDAWNPGLARPARLNHRAPEVERDGAAPGIVIIGRTGVSVREMPFSPPPTAVFRLRAIFYFVPSPRNTIRRGDQRLGGATKRIRRPNSAREAMSRRPSSSPFPISGRPGWRLGYAQESGLPFELDHRNPTTFGLTLSSRPIRSVTSAVRIKSIIAEQGQS